MRDVNLWSNEALYDTRKEVGTSIILHFVLAPFYWIALAFRLSLVLCSFFCCYTVFLFYAYLFLPFNFLITLMVARICLKGTEWPKEPRQGLFLLEVYKNFIPSRYEHEVPPFWDRTSVCVRMSFILSTCSQLFGKSDWAGHWRLTSSRLKCEVSPCSTANSLLARKPNKRCTYSCGPSVLVHIHFDDVYFAVHNSIWGRHKESHKELIHHKWAKKSEPFKQNGKGESSRGV